LNQKYLKWELGDAQKIYNALKSTTKNSDGIITDPVIESLESDKIVGNFFTMILTHIKYKLNLATEPELENAKARYHAGPFMEKVKNTKAGQNFMNK